MYDTPTEALKPAGRGRVEESTVPEGQASIEIPEPDHPGSVFGIERSIGLGGLGGTPGALEEVHVFWLAGMSCDGCTVAVSGATAPSVEQLLGGTIPGLPRAVLHHPVLSVAAGHDFVKPFRQAVEGTLGAPYVVILEGSVPDDQAFEHEGYFSGLGVGADWPESLPAPRSPEQPLRVTDWLRAMAPGAAACMAIGTCATWGGIPAAAGNITGSMSMMDFLGKDYSSALGVPVINVPGCSPIGDNFNEVVALVLMFLQGLGPLPEFDELGRPAWQFSQTVHRRCPRAGFYEEGVFAKEFGDEECLVDVGCWGPVVQCNITERGAINHMGGCMVAGGACIGCTMPGFPDKFSPFYKAPPGSALSGAASRTYGGAIRRLRRMTMSSDNREPLWDNTGEVPTAWAVEQRKPSRASKVMGYFYKKLQYTGTVDYGKRNRRQPVPKSIDVFQYDGGGELARYLPPDAHGEEGAKPSEEEQ
jgi:hydrogenase small subunit